MSMNDLTDHLRIAALRANPEPIVIPTVFKQPEEREPGHSLEIRTTRLCRRHDNVAGKTEHEIIEPDIGNEDMKPGSEEEPVIAPCVRSGATGEPLAVGLPDDKRERVARIGHEIKCSNRFILRFQMKTKPGAQGNA